jgi:hypothetical protein
VVKVFYLVGTSRPTSAPFPFSVELVDGLWERMDEREPEELKRTDKVTLLFGGMRHSWDELDVGYPSQLRPFLSGVRSEDEGSGVASFAMVPKAMTTTFDELARETRVLAREELGAALIFCQCS